MSDPPPRQQPASSQSQPQAAERPPARPADQPTRTPARTSARTTPEHGLGIEPTASDDNSPSLLFSWQPVEIGEGESYGCTITAPADSALTVTIEQSPYQKTMEGRGSVTIVAIPLGSVGARGRLIARNSVTGTSAEFTWRWQPRHAGGVAIAQPATGWTKMSGFVRRMAALAQHDSSKGASAEAGVRVEPIGVPASALDGEWISAGSFTPYAVRINGRVGTCTLSNAPAVYSVGDAILYLDTRDDKSLSGRHIYADGTFRPVTGTLTQPGCLAMAHIGPDRFVVQSWELRRR